MTLSRIPIRGWKRCVHEAAAFESHGEYAAATLLDDSTSIEWWMRNDPPSFRIPTPMGNFEPDFLYQVARKGQTIFGVLEVKSDIFWDGEGSEARVKANAAVEWVRAVNVAAPETQWEFGEVLDQDAINVSSFEELRNVALLRFPE